MSWPSHNVRQTTDIGTAQGRVQKYFVDGTAAELRGQFDIEEHDGSDRPGTYHVTMVPKRKQIREALARLDLWVMRSTLLLDAMRMTFANGDTKMMAFDDVVPNAALEPGTFSIDALAPVPVLVRDVVPQLLDAQTDDEAHLSTDHGDRDTELHVCAARSYVSLW